MAEGEVLGPGEGEVIALPGATMVFKALSGRASGDYVVGEFTAAPGFSGPRPHVHGTHEELFYVLEGEFDFFLGDRVVRLGPGAFVAVPPGARYEYASTPAPTTDQTRRAAKSLCKSRPSPNAARIGPRSMR